jgi:hypothetical protein
MLREQNKGSALGLIERFGAQMLATARRYSANLDDAEDAYQRAAEILLRTRPSGSDEQVLRWLRTTIRGGEIEADRAHVGHTPDRVPGVHLAHASQHLRTPLAQGLGDRAADTAVAAGDKCRAAFDFHAVLLPELARGKRTGLYAGDAEWGVRAGDLGEVLVLGDDG